MERALFLAERGRGRTSPNPIVGAVVVVADGVVVGQGAHLGAGGPHAEVVALDAAGDRARGATLYCTLEPCATPAAPARASSASSPRASRGSSRRCAIRNPRVAGRGFAYCGRTASRSARRRRRRRSAERQNAPFFTWVTRTASVRDRSRPPMSADGFVGRAGRPRQADRRRRPTGTSIGSGPRSTRSRSARARCSPTIRC